ncbi:hypothetical protein [Roseofilum sp. Guam]|uniref:hypothetical protein n=1 Tax=Roseofilum sp. Guam TaxID=2821502 RepID=UPI001B0AC4F9|nr:hypothetical protein [Roseofilum sp. Guam]MBP0031503.1 hypothetical protein [Roseofilum sp. Guam]
MDTYKYFHSNQIDPSKLVDHELVRAYLKACQKSTPKGVRITQVRGRLFLRFKTATRSGNSDNSCNESFTRDGCVNALAKAIAVSDKLKTLESESEFWEWYESEIKGTKTLVDDCLTIGDAIEIVKKNYLSGYDKCGRDRSEEKSQVNTLANYQLTYGNHHQRLNPKLKLNGENLISEIMKHWGELHRKKTKGFKNAYTACCKLLRDCKLPQELDKVTNHFGVIKVVSKTKQQTIDIESFIDFRDRVLGLNGYLLTKKQQEALGNRRSWFKAFSFNLLYGFRASEFKAILNLDKPVKRGDRVFLALYDPENTENIAVLGDGFWITDTSGKRHWITIKTGKRISAPMIHPNYPSLIELLDIKNPSVPMPECIPKSDSDPKTFKNAYTRRMGLRLSDYIKQVGGQGFTQTHALRHLANYHGTIAGLTTKQRSWSLGHSDNMNDSYYGHLSVSSEVELMTSDISGNQKVRELESELTQAQETIKSLEETILFLKKENARLNELLGGNDDLPRIG